MTTTSNRYNPKSFEEIADYGDAFTAFADDLAAVQQQGPVTHLIFAMGIKSTSEYRSGERRVMARIIVPTELISQIALQLGQDNRRALLETAPLVPMH
jgi:hypothetical protein